MFKVMKLAVDLGESPWSVGLPLSFWQAPGAVEEFKSQYINLDGAPLKVSIIIVGS